MLTIGVELTWPAAAPPGLRRAEAAVPRERDRQRAAVTPDRGGEAAVEDALLLAVGRGDREDPLRELYHRYERRLFALGLRLLDNRGLAEELVQETFLRLWRTADRFDPERGSAGAFIYAIARRLVIDLWRRPSSRPLGAEIPEHQDPEDVIDQALLAISVRHALDALSEPHREVLELTYASDLTQAEIASRLGLPVGTVKSRMYHALRHFRRAAEERGLDG